MFIRINKTEIYDTTTMFLYRLDELGQLEVFNDYQNTKYVFEKSLIIWEQLLQQIVYQNNNYLSVLNDYKTCREQSELFLDQIFREFNELKEEFTKTQADREREEKNIERREYIDIDSIEF